MLPWKQYYGKHNLKAVYKKEIIPHIEISRNGGPISENSSMLYITNWAFILQLLHNKLVSNIVK